MKIPAVSRSCSVITGTRRFGWTMAILASCCLLALAGCGTAPAGAPVVGTAQAAATSVAAAQTQVVGTVQAAVTQVAPTVAVVQTQAAGTVQAAATQVASSVAGGQTQVVGTVQAAATQVAPTVGAAQTQAAGTAQAAATQVASSVAGGQTQVVGTVQTAATQVGAAQTQATGTAQAAATQVASSVAVAQTQVVGTVQAAATQVAPTVGAVQTQVAATFGPPLATAVAISSVQFSAVRIDPNDSVIVVTNKGTTPVNLGSWILLLGPSPAVLPASAGLLLQPGGTVTLHLAGGTDAAADVYLGLASQALLNSLTSGTRLVLVDPRGQMASLYQLP